MDRSSQLVCAEELLSSVSQEILLWHDVDLCAGGLTMYDGGLQLCVIELDLDTTL